MKLFNRGNDAKAVPAGPAAVASPAPLTSTSVAPAATSAPLAAPAPAAQSPDITAILDANVKEMSEKIAKLTTSLEGSQSEKSGFEAKIEAMEERMRKLSSLTEMISAQYNPFVGDAPSERESLPSPEVGLSSPMPPMASLPPMPAMASLPPMPPLPSGALSMAPLEMPPMGAPDAGFPPMPAFDLPPAAPYASAHAPPAAAFDEHEEGHHVWTVRPTFESSLLMLGWADMLLKNVPTRDSLVELVDYYHNIGWIGDPARDQLLAYADGIAVPPPGNQPDWRASVEVHEKSLLFVEKLKTISARGR